jgi:hypothetical protein
MEVGTLLTFIVIFLALGLTGTRLDWSGNTIYTNSESTQYCEYIKMVIFTYHNIAADWFGLPYRTPPAEGFGPTSGCKSVARQPDC